MIRLRLTPSEGKAINRLRALAFALVCLVSACATNPTATLIPPPASPAPPTHTPAPAVTLDPYTLFMQNLKTAVESNDEALLRKLVASPWLNGRYRSEMTQYANAADAVAAFRTLRQRAGVIVELSHTAAQPTDAQKFGERIVVSRWDMGGGREEIGYLYVSLVNGEWRWVALLTGVPANLVSVQAATPKPPATLPPALVGRGYLVYGRGKNIYARNLADNTDALATDVGDISQWDWTRDGARAVFVRGVNAASEIWTINRNGANAKRLTNDNASDGSPRWSPDGAQIVFEHNIQTDPVNRFKIKGEVWTMSADGNNKRKLSDGYDPAWSPEGQRIAFASNPKAVKGDATQWLSWARNGIHLMNAQGRNEWTPISTDTTSPKFTPMEWQMTLARLVDSPLWSPDGREITLRAHSPHGSYVTTNSTGGGFGKFIALFYDDIAGGFSYSPDGQYIAFATGGLSGYNTVGIFRRAELGRDGASATSAFRTLGKLPRQSGDVPQSVGAYAWSPDSIHIAYSLLIHSTSEPNKAPAAAGIWVMNLASGESVQVNADGNAPLFWLP